eukprot:Nitzschia sp. Nitz4//scaffold67_size101165//85389//86684//NITZ4_004542-RA/size101165-processed-gene-0.65-mRNA-1//-1//CDS//3329556513//750//frame0
MSQKFNTSDSSLRRRSFEGLPPLASPVVSKWIPSREDDAVSVTERSTVTSSEDSSFVGVVVNTTGLVGKIKNSAKSFQAKSAHWVQHQLHRTESTRSLKSNTTTRTSVTAATNNATTKTRKKGVVEEKLCCRLKRFNRDPLVTSRAVLCVTSLALVLSAGDRLFAASWAAAAVAILHETTLHGRTKPMEVWYFISVASFLVGAFSCAIWTEWGHTVPMKDYSNDKVWVWGRGFPRAWGCMLAFLLYNSLVAPYDEEEDVPIHTWTVHLSLLEARNLGSSHSTGETMTDRWSFHDCTIQVRHGPVTLGSADAQKLIRGGADNGSAFYEAVRPKRFQHLVFSHFLESQPSVVFDVVSNTDEKVVVGSAEIPVPDTSLVKVVGWFPVYAEGGTSEQRGELQVQIQTVLTPQKFLLRPRVIFPLLLSIFFLFRWR